eukprot:scaffold115720_cov60-Attheya_sp.AAC.1
MSWQDAKPTMTIMADLHTSASPEIVGVMKNVPNPYTSNQQNIIVRTDDDTFWKQCITELEGGITRRRMAIIGTPGIEKVRHYIEFSPKNGTVEIALFPESESPIAISSLRKEATYLLVDPGQTKINCNPIEEISARVIIVASPDERHWGKSSFRKKTEVGDGGVFRYFRPWTLAQLTGGSSEADENEKELKRKVECVSLDKLKNWVSGHVYIHAGFGSDQPHSGIVTFEPTDNCKDAHLELASPRIVQWVRKRCLSNIWTDLATYPTPMAWQFLEQYTQVALHGVNTYSTRLCVGKNDGRYGIINPIAIGGCTGSSFQNDCTSAVQAGADGVLCYSSNRFHPLYDMLFKTGNTYYAFQVTIGTNHDAKQKHIDNLVRVLQIGTGGRELRLFYAVHAANFDAFVTNPVQPRCNTVSSVAFKSASASVSPPRAFSWSWNSQHLSRRTSRLYPTVVAVPTVGVVGGIPTDNTLLEFTCF